MKLLLLSGLILLNACGAYRWFGHKVETNHREIASLSVKELLAEESESFSLEIDDKLLALHSYYIIGQKNLKEFDASIEEDSLEKIYASDAYMNLLAVRAQAEEIEHEINDIKSALENNPIKIKADLSRSILLQQRINEFAAKSNLSAMSMENLIAKLSSHSSSAKNNQKLAIPEKVTLDLEYKRLSATKEFQVYEKNIEHLSHLMEIKITRADKKIFPAVGKSGNITGNEFPAKVWSITFDDGPGKLTSPIILKHLKDRELKATFFQLAQQVNALPAVAREIKEAGMEIASHSYTHKQLTKVGDATLNKEIGEATAEIEKFHKVDVKFFRLPYGAGVHSPAIRQKIADNALIHVFWNVDTLDWMSQEPDKIVARTKGLMKKTPHDAGIILFHDIHMRTAKASPVIMDYLNKDARRTCTLNEIVNQINEGIDTVCPK